MYDIGDVVRLRVMFLDAAGNASDPDTVTLTLSNAGGVTTYTYADEEIERDNVGSYHVDYVIESGSTHYIKWTSTGTPTTSEGAIFHVRSG